MISSTHVPPAFTSYLHHVFLRLLCALSCLLLLLAPGRLQAQAADGTPSSIEEAQFRWGPLGLSPRIAVTNVGMDSNVFNAANTPERDFTATVSPGADTWVRFGVAQLSLKTSLDWTYFRRAAQQRWIGVSQEGRFDLLFNRLNPYVSGVYTTTRQRPNLEIDARIRQKQQRVGVGTALHLGARVTLDAEASHALVDFSDASFGEDAIASALNRDSREAVVAAHIALTPLTTFIVSAAAVQDRFERSSLRDSDSLLILPGIELEPSALISGRADVGFRRFDVLDPAVPDFTGLVASVDVNYIALELTRFTVSLTRDVDYSVEQQEPYSVVTNAGLTVTQVLGFDWYVLGRASRARLDYRSLPGAASTAARRDSINTFGVGIARRLGTDLRLGFDIDRVSRRSPRDGRDYDGYRLGGSMTYGSIN